MRRLGICILLVTVLLTFTLAPVGADTEDSNNMIAIQPHKSEWPYIESISKFPVFPEGKWVSFTLPVAKKTYQYYFIFNATKKPGYKTLVSTYVDRSKKCNEINIWIPRYSYEESSYSGIVPSGELYKFKAYLDTDTSYLIEVMKSNDIFDSEEAPIRMRLDEVPMNPTKGKLSSVSAKKKGFTVSYKKSKYATKYAVAYKVKGGKWNYAYTTKLKKSVSKLKSKKKYTVKVRAIRVVDGKKYYGRWSAGKTVRTK